MDSKCQVLVGDEVVGEFDTMWEADLVGEVEAFRSRYGYGASADKMVLVVDRDGNRHPTNIFTGDDVHGPENKYGLDRRDSEVLYRDFLADFLQKLDDGLLALYKRTGDRFPTLDYVLPDFVDVLEQYVDGS